MECPNCGPSPENDPGCRHDQISKIVDRLDAVGWIAMPDFLDGREVEAVRREILALRAEGEFRQAGVGRGETFRLAPEIRSDFVHWLDQANPSPLQAGLMERYENLRSAINQQLYLGLFSWEGHFTIYPAGAHYSRHLDQFRNAMHRTVSTILYLNEDWESEDGGHLRIHLGNGDARVDILPRGGTLVSFLSERFEHEVLPAKRERISLTGWFARRL